MMQWKHNRITDRQAGLTLVELLVVISVITILVAVVMPVALQARNRSRAIACVSNLRQIGQAVMVYSQDCGDKLPQLRGTQFAASEPTSDWPEGSSATELRMLLAGRVRDARIYHCANDLGAAEYGYSARDGSVYSRAGSSYTPWSTARSGRYGRAMNGARLAVLSPASGYWLLRDYGSDWHGFRSRSGMNIESQSVANGVFADGHAAAIRVYPIRQSGRRYVCIAAHPVGSGGMVSVSGGSNDVGADLTGYSSFATDAGGAGQLELRLSGVVTCGETSQDVDRVFTFGKDAKLEAAFRQVVYWVDSLAAN